MCAYGSVARARSCACLTSKARSTNNHAVYTPRRFHGNQEYEPHRSQVRWSSRNQHHNTQTRAREVRVPPGPPTGGEPAYGIKPWPSQGGKVAGGATSRQTTTGPVRPIDCVHHETESCPLRSLCRGKSLRDPTRSRLARRYTFPKLESHSAAPALLCHPSDGGRRSSAPRLQKSTPSRGRQGQKGR